MKSTAIYPGTFDPVTYGHLDLIQRAGRIFDEVIVAVAGNSQKNPLFTVQERMEMLKKASKGFKGVRIDSFDGLVIDYARKNKVHVLIRGLRMISDFEFKLQMALTNRRLDEKIETVFLMPSEKYSFLSSTLIREAAFLGGDVSSFVPGFVARKLKERLSAGAKK